MRHIVQSVFSFTILGFNNYQIVSLVQKVLFAVLLLLSSLLS